MTEKTLGQIAWDALGDVPWQSLEAWQQKYCETMVQDSVLWMIDRIYCASHKLGATFQMSDTTTIAELEEQRAELDAKIAAAKEKSMAGAIAAVKSLMESSGVTLEMLGGRKARTPRAAAAAAPKQTRSTKGVRIAAKYRSPMGETWSGRGLKPNWLRAELMKGAKLEDFAVTAEAA